MEKLLNAVKMLLSEPMIFFDNILELYGSWLPDEVYLRLRYRFKLGRWPNLKNPVTFTEKINWLKLHNRKPEYTTMVDKYAVKDYVALRIGEQYIIPTLGVWDSVDDIDWEVLPDQFVLKTTHGGGGCGVVICKDKATFDRKKAVRTLRNSMRIDIYKTYREWPYKGVPKRVIAEKFMASKNNPVQSVLFDYKFFCFNGKVEFFKVDYGRFVEHHANYYSPEGMLLDFGEQELEPDPNYKIELPANLGDMICLAERLSQDIPFIRVDLYNINGDIYFGELTIFPAAGMGAFTNHEYWDLEIGKKLML